MNGVSHKVGGAVEDNAGVGICVDTPYDVDGVGGEAEVLHDSVEFGVRDGVEGTGEVNVEGIDVFV